jgi:hypothetical protein
VDSEGLWFRVLAARYGVERGCLKAWEEWFFMVEGDHEDS